MNGWWLRAARAEEIVPVVLNAVLPGASTSPLGVTIIVTQCYDAGRYAPLVRKRSCASALDRALGRPLNFAFRPQ